MVDFKELKDKAQGLISEHSDAIKGGIDKVGAMVGDRIGHDKVDKVEDTLSGLVDKAAGRDPLVESVADSDPLTHPVTHPAGDPLVTASERADQDPTPAASTTVPPTEAAVVDAQPPGARVVDPPVVPPAPRVVPPTPRDPSSPPAG